MSQGMETGLTLSQALAGASGVPPRDGRSMVGKLEAGLPVGSPACPNCGSDERTGWIENADLWSADLPSGYKNDDEFDYDAFVHREFGDHEGTGRPFRARVSGIGVVAIVLIIALIWVFVF